MKTSELMEAIRQYEAEQGKLNAQALLMKMLSESVLSPSISSAKFDCEGFTLSLRKTSKKL